ncbi:hypothetical protein Bxe_B1756 [Paraburkholderia xenovorans LB400]|uniref:Uncharacterized protein n=1 Tax=Paraburkholderia xenovorans (strain LB400) TaxID=266265 RepID=Q13NX9_PARXL|nr:hypothetical protein Bxe_B1756 [Paraburkholderia xenovorans LB400]
MWQRGFLEDRCAAGAYATVIGAHARVRHSRHASHSGAGTPMPGELTQPSFGTQGVDKCAGGDTSFSGVNDGSATGQTSSLSAEW